jgi:PAS domain S-box-containing protein
MKENLWEYFAPHAEDFAFIVTDEEDRIRGWSKGAEQMLGFTLHEIEGRPYDFLLPPEDRRLGVAETERQEAIRAGRLEADRRYITRDGGEVGARVVVRRQSGPARGGGRFSRIVYPVLLQGEAAAALRPAAVMRQLIHEWKNHLHVIISLIRLQETAEREEKVSRVLAQIEGRVRAIASVYQGLQGSNVATIDADRLLRAIGEEARNEARSETPIRFECADIALDLKRAVPLALLVRELTCDAFEHARVAGRGEITIRLAYVKQPEDSGVPRLAQLEILSSSTIDAADPEETVHSSPGLNLVQALAKQLHGTLSTHSTGMACVEVRFPLE